MKKKWISLLTLLAGVLVLLSACGEEEYEPQAINEDTDICEICNMAIKDDYHATQIITTDGQSLKFDDIGCMNTWMTENGTDMIGAAFVRDYNSKQWLPYEKAYYVYDASFTTPMAYGIVSFENEEDAQAFIEEQGTGILMTAAELDNHSWERNSEMMHMEGMDGHDHSHSSEEAHEDGMSEHSPEMNMEHSSDSEHQHDGGHTS